MMNLNKIISLSVLLSVALSCLTGCTDLINFSEEKIKEAEFIIDCSGCSAEEKSPPLWVVNDKIIHQDSVKNLNPKDIRSISVLKGQEAINLFGSAGKHGVVQIQTDQKRFTAK